MNNMGKSFAEKKTDYTFIISLVAIIIVAVYLYINRFGETNITQYLQKTGQELLARVTNTKERDKLEKSYSELLSKIEKQEVSPKSVEYLTANLINLKQMQKSLNPDEIKLIFEAAIDSIGNVKVKRELDSEQEWFALQKKINDINKLENQVNKIRTEGSAKSFSFSYTFDDSLNIIIDQQLKDDLLKGKRDQAFKELINLEKQKAVKWKKDVEFDQQKKVNEIKKKLELLDKELKNINSTVKVSIDIASEKDPSVSISSPDSSETKK